MVGHFIVDTQSPPCPACVLPHAHDPTSLRRAHAGAHHSSTTEHALLRLDPHHRSGV